MSPRRLAVLGVVLLFGLCGLLSGRFFEVNGGWRTLLLPIPFGVAAAFLFLRSAKAILVVPLYALVWTMAYFVAMDMAISRTPQSDYIPMCLAGLVGGLGVCLASGIVNRCLLSRRYLLAACLVGCVAALPFGLWLGEIHRALSINAHEDALQATRLLCSFAIWQAAVGAYLYVVCTGWKRKQDAGAGFR